MNAPIQPDPGDGAPGAPAAARVPPLQLVIASALLVLVLFLFVGSVAQLLNPGFGIWFSEAFLFLGLTWVLVRMSGRDPVAWTGFRFPGWGTTLFGFAVGAANFFAIAVPIQYAATKLFPESITELFDSSRIFRDRSVIDLALIIAGVTIAAPIGEEFFFRGVMQNGLTEARKKTSVAIGVTAVIFSAFHFDPVGLLARIELGVLFGWLFYRTRSIWPSAMAHAANNAITTVLFFAGGGAAGREAEAQVPIAEELVQLALMAGIGLLALGGLMRLSARYPSLLAARPVQERRPPANLTFFRCAAPWAVGAVLSVAVLFLLDARGVVLNVYDGIYPLPEGVSRDEAATEALSELRRRARAGVVPMEEYVRARQELIERAETSDGEDLPPEVVPEAAPPPPATGSTAPPSPEGEVNPVPDGAP